jgi:hypothetical protein
VDLSANIYHFSLCVFRTPFIIDYIVGADHLERAARISFELSVSLIPRFHSLKLYFQPRTFLMRFSQHKITGRQTHTLPLPEDERVNILDSI